MEVRESRCACAVGSHPGAVWACLCSRITLSERARARACGCFHLGRAGGGAPLGVVLHAAAAVRAARRARGGVLALRDATEKG